MLHIFLPFIVFTLALKDVQIESLQELWLKSGCTEDGLLYPSETNNFFWRTKKDIKFMIDSLLEGVKKGDRISLYSCEGYR